MSHVSHENVSPRLACFEKELGDLPDADYQAILFDHVSGFSIFETLILKTRHDLASHPEHTEAIIRHHEKEAIFFEDRLKNKFRDAKNDIIKENSRVSGGGPYSEEYANDFSYRLQRIQKELQALETLKKGTQWCAA